MTPVRIGVIGCGAISNQYFNAARKFPILDIVACSDMNPAAAQKKAAEFGVGKVLSVDELLADASVEIVLNLTIPAAHVPVALRAIEAGKHTYAEKPLGLSVAEGRKLLDAAAARGLRVGCAPDTFLGAGIQTARKLIDDGAIGRPVACSALMLSRGVEHWHPNPAFYYAPGGGPMFDMGPYYLTALLNLLGPVRRVMGMAAVAIQDRMITSQPYAGQAIKVTAPDHVTGLMEFASGCTGTITTSFATRAAEYDNANPIAIFGTQGSLRVPDPNGFDGTVHLCRFGEKDEYVPSDPLFATGHGRSVGLADMAHALRSHRPARCSGEQAMAVLEMMQGFHTSSDTGQAIDITPGYQRPAPMPIEEA